MSSLVERPITAASDDGVCRWHAACSLLFLCLLESTRDVSLHSHPGSYRESRMSFSPAINHPMSVALIAGGGNASTWHVSDNTYATSSAVTRINDDGQCHIVADCHNRPVVLHDNCCTSNGFLQLRLFQAGASLKAGSI